MTARLLFVVLLAAAACGEPTQYEGQIPIVPGAAARAMAIMQKGKDEHAGKPPAIATVHPMLAGEELGGTRATGRPGDWVIANEEVEFVVDRIDHPLAPAESGGNLVDAADARVKKDELGQIGTSLGALPKQAVYTSMTSGEKADGSAWIEVVGHALGEEKLLVVTRYALAAVDRALLVTTKITNASDHPIDKLVLGDTVAWGTAETIAPGKELHFEGASTGAYLGGVGHFVSYALASTDGDLTATSDSAGSITAMTSETTLAPGASTDVGRAFAVGKRGDTASLIAELTQMAGGDVGEIAIDLVGDDGKSATTPAGAKIVFFGPRVGPSFWMRATNDGDPLGGEVPPGHYALAFDSADGRRVAGANVEVDIEAGKIARATLTTTALGR